MDRDLEPRIRAVTAWSSLITRDHKFSKSNSRDKSWPRPRQCVLVLQGEELVPAMAKTHAFPAGAQGRAEDRRGVLSGDSHRAHSGKEVPSGQAPWQLALPGPCPSPSPTPPHRRPHCRCVWGFLELGEKVHIQSLSSQQPVPPCACLVPPTPATKPIHSCSCGFRDKVWPSACEFQPGLWSRLNLATLRQLTTDVCV